MKTLEDVLEEITPTPDPDFVADMERRMQLGFPPRRKRRLPQIDLSRLRPRAVAAVAASALLALLVTLSVTGGGSGEGDGDRPVPVTEGFSESGGVSAQSGGGAAESTEVTPDSDLALRSRPQPVPPPGGDGNFAPGAEIRRIERSAQLTLAADPDDFDALADTIFRTADRHDGFVLSSSFTQGEDDFSTGSFELRVPSNELQATLNELSRIATVRVRSESGNDVTGSFVSIRDRLRTAQALRASLLRRLELAVTDTAVRALTRRLEIVGNRITSLRAQFRAIRERTEFATVLITLVDEDAGTSSASETDEAVDDAVGSLEDVLNFLIRAAGVLLPVAFVGLLVWLVAVRVRRRARERSLA